MFVLVVGLTLAGFRGRSIRGGDPGLGGAAVLAVRIVRSANVSSLVFVLALGVVVQAVVVNGMGRAMSAVLPSGSGLPATLVLLPLIAPSGPVAILAVLIGVNIGPNLTYLGSLSNLLWRRVLRQYNVEAGVGEYTRLGVCTVPATLVVAVVALRASAHLLGV